MQKGRSGNMEHIDRDAEKIKSLLIDVRNGIAVLTLNRPKYRNALSKSVILELSDALMELENNSAVRVIIIAARGPAFCSGHDMKEIRAYPSREFYANLFSLSSALMKQILSLSKPVIAKVQGVTSAAGCQLVATCDLAIASDQVEFSTPGVDIGLFCSTPMVALSRNVGRKHAMHMLLTGDRISAQRALEIGLINDVVSPEKLDDAVEELAQKIASKSLLAISMGKQAFYRQMEQGLSDAYEYTGLVMAENMLARDAEEGIDAFLEKRLPQWSDS